MPFPLLFIAIAAGTGVLGIGKTVKAGIDTHTAKKVTEDANSILEKAKRRLNNARKKSAESLENLGRCKIDILDTSINQFVRLFEQIKNVDFRDSEGLSELNKLKLDKQTLKELKEMGGFATTILGGVASGALGGALTAFGAYSAAGAFAAASTSTAIATLHGVAATNATLAFFGGGSLAAGGLGMAGGTMVLGGLVAGPALAIMGFIVGAKASKSKNDAYSNLALAKKNAKEIDLAVTLCNAISKRCQQFCELLNQLDARFRPLIKAMDETIRTYGKDYSKYPAENKKAIAAATALAVSIKAVLDTPILTKDGQLTGDSANILQEYQSGTKRLKEPSGNPMKVEKVNLSVSQIVVKCSSKRYREDGEKPSTSELLGLYGRVDWGDLLTMVNYSYGTVFDVKTMKAAVDGFGENTPVELWDLDFDVRRLVLLWQVGQIVQSCSKEDVLNSMVVDIKDVDWDRLIGKIETYYGKKMSLWQLTNSGTNKSGQIEPQTIFEAIMAKVSSVVEEEGYLLHQDIFAQAVR